MTEAALLRARTDAVASDLQRAKSDFLRPIETSANPDRSSAPQASPSFEAFRQLAAPFIRLVHSSPPSGPGGQLLGNRQRLEQGPSQGRGLGNAPGQGEGAKRRKGQETGGGRGAGVGKAQEGPFGPIDRRGRLDEFERRSYELLVRATRDDEAATSARFVAELCRRIRHAVDHLTLARNALYNDVISQLMTSSGGETSAENATSSRSVGHDTGGHKAASNGAGAVGKEVNLRNHHGGGAKGANAGTTADDLNAAIYSPYARSLQGRGGFLANGQRNGTKLYHDRRVKEARKIGANVRPTGNHPSSARNHAERLRLSFQERSTGSLPQKNLSDPRSNDSNNESTKTAKSEGSDDAARKRKASSDKSPVGADRFGERLKEVGLELDRQFDVFANGSAAGVSGVVDRKQNLDAKDTDEVDRVFPVLNVVQMLIENLTTACQIAHSWIDFVYPVQTSSKSVAASKSVDVNGKTNSKETQYVLRGSRTNNRNTTAATNGNVTSTSSDLNFIVVGSTTGVAGTKQGQSKIVDAHGPQKGKTVVNLRDNEAANPLTKEEPKPVSNVHKTVENKVVEPLENDVIKPLSDTVPEPLTNEVVQPKTDKVAEYSTNEMPKPSGSEVSSQSVNLVSQSLTNDAPKPVNEMETSLLKEVKSPMENDAEKTPNKVTVPSIDKETKPQVNEVAKPKAKESKKASVSQASKLAANAESTPSANDVSAHLENEAEKPVTIEVAKSQATNVEKLVAKEPPKLPAKEKSKRGSKLLTKKNTEVNVEHVAEADDLPLMVESAPKTEAKKAVVSDTNVKESTEKAESVSSSTSAESGSAAGDGMTAANGLINTSDSTGNTSDNEQITANGTIAADISNHTVTAVTKISEQTIPIATKQLPLKVSEPNIKQTVPISVKQPPSTVSEPNVEQTSPTAGKLQPTTASEQNVDAVDTERFQESDYMSITPAMGIVRALAFRRANKAAQLARSQTLEQVPEGDTDQPLKTTESLNAAATNDLYTHAQVHQTRMVSRTKHKTAAEKAAQMKTMGPISLEDQKQAVATLVDASVAEPSGTRASTTAHRSRLTSVPSYRQFSTLTNRAKSHPSLSLTMDDMALLHLRKPAQMALDKEDAKSITTTFSEDRYGTSSARSPSRYLSQQKQNIRRARAQLAHNRRQCARADEELARIDQEAAQHKDVRHCKITEKQQKLNMIEFLDLGIQQTSRGRGEGGASMLLKRARLLREVQLLDDDLVEIDSVLNQLSDEARIKGEQRLVRMDEGDVIAERYELLKGELERAGGDISFADSVDDVTANALQRLPTSLAIESETDVTTDALQQNSLAIKSHDDVTVNAPKLSSVIAEVPSTNEVVPLEPSKIAAAPATKLAAVVKNAGNLKSKVVETGSLNSLLRPAKTNQPSTANVGGSLDDLRQAVAPPASKVPLAPAETNASNLGGKRNTKSNKDASTEPKLKRRLSDTDARASIGNHSNNKRFNSPSKEAATIYDIKRISAISNGAVSGKKNFAISINNASSKVVPSGQTTSMQSTIPATHVKMLHANVVDSEPRFGQKRTISLNTKDSVTTRSNEHTPRFLIRKSFVSPGSNSDAQLTRNKPTSFSVRGGGRVHQKDDLASTSPARLMAASTGDALSFQTSPSRWNRSFKQPFLSFTSPNPNKAWQSKSISYPNPDVGKKYSQTAATKPYPSQAWQSRTGQLVETGSKAVVEVGAASQPLSQVKDSSVIKLSASLRARIQKKIAERRRLNAMHA